MILRISTSTLSGARPQKLKPCALHPLMAPSGIQRRHRNGAFVAAARGGSQFAASLRLRRRLSDLGIRYSFCPNAGVVHADVRGRRAPAYRCRAGRCLAAAFAPNPRRRAKIRRGAGRCVGARAAFLGLSSLDFVSASWQRSRDAWHRGSVVRLDHRASQLENLRYRWELDPRLLRRSRRLRPERIVAHAVA